MNIVRHRKIFYAIALLLIAASLFAIFYWKLNLGVDFKGGALVEVEYTGNRPEVSEVKERVKALDLQESIRATGEKGYIIRTKTLDEAQHIELLNALNTRNASTTGAVMEKRFDSIGPLLGAEAAKKSLVSIILVLICIVLFITYAFRQVSEPVASWKYGLIAIVSLIHDVLVPAGVFAFLGHYFGYEIDTLFVTALLVVLGFSIHDTIVVFDRVRENLKHADSKETFEHTVGKSISQTFTRSINTSLTTLLALFVLYFVGPEATKHFSLALLIGITAGTYSSIFIGSPLLVTVEKWQKNKAAKRAEKHSKR